MWRAVVVLALVPAIASADPKPVADVSVLFRRGIAFDLELAGGVRVEAPSGDRTRAWFGRACAGVLLFDEPNFVSVGIAGQLGPLDSSALGLEAQFVEVFHGFSAQVGVFPVDSIGGTTLEGQLGWTVLGVEYERRVSGPRDGDRVIVLLVQAPLGVLWQMLHDPSGVNR
jgi:hypothetical protein